MQAEPDIAELEPRAVAIRRHIMERITPRGQVAQLWMAAPAAPNEPPVEEVT